MICNKGMSLTYHYTEVSLKSVVFCGRFTCVQWTKRVPTLPFTDFTKTLHEADYKYRFKKSGEASLSFSSHLAFDKFHYFVSKVFRELRNYLCFIWTNHSENKAKCEICWCNVRGTKKKLRLPLFLSLSIVISFFKFHCLVPVLVVDTFVRLLYQLIFGSCKIWHFTRVLYITEKYVFLHWGNTCKQRHSNKDYSYL